MPQVRLLRRIVPAVFLIGGAPILSVPYSLAQEAPAHQDGHAMPADTAATSYETAAPPLWEQTGTLAFPITTSDPEAQKYFDQGLRFSHGFNHAEARRSFREAQRRDPACAMCYWGEALVLGPNINAPMMPDAVEPAMAALRQAQSLAGKATPKEQALIGALAARYSSEPPADRSGLDEAYAEVMAAVAERFPDDALIAVLAAEAALDTQPWDYWEADKTTPKGRTAEAVALLEKVIAAHPDDYSAIHLYIHAVEASSDPGRAEAYADRMAKMDLGGLGHLVHMPSHIYYRVGRYADSMRSNQIAAEADEKFLAESGATGIYPFMYYSHNVHFVMSSAQMSGDGETALAAADKLLWIIPDEAARAMPMVEAIKSSVYGAYTQYSEPAAILNLPAPAEDLPLMQVMWRYARGTALALQGDVAAARAEAEAIDKTAETVDFAAMAAAMTPGKEIVGIAREVLLGRIARSEGDLDGAIGHLEAAVKIQDSLPYMEPPWWYYPVRQSLGATQLQAGRPDEAEATFRAALIETPRSGWVVYGLAETERARNDEAAAVKAEAELDGLWTGETGELTLERL